MLKHGEEIEAAAFREAEEELGLSSSNFKGTPFHVLTKIISGLDATYPLHVYAIEVENKTDFKEPHHETGKTLWLTIGEYSKVGRKNQLAFVDALLNILE